MYLKSDVKELHSVSHKLVGAFGVPDTVPLFVLADTGIQNRYSVTNDMPKKETLPQKADPYVRQRCQEALLQIQRS